MKSIKKLDITDMSDPLVQKIAMRELSRELGLFDEYLDGQFEVTYDCYKSMNVEVEGCPDEYEIFGNLTYAEEAAYEYLVDDASHWRDVVAEGYTTDGLEEWAENEVAMQDVGEILPGYEGSIDLPSGFVAIRK